MFEVQKRALAEHVRRNFGDYREGEQKQRFLDSTDPELHELLFDGERLVAFFWAERSAGEFNLHRISIEPDYQRQGLGTTLIRELQNEVAAEEIPLRLQVFPRNPALRLYQRLGFREEGRTETHIHMVWSPQRGT